MNHGRALKFTDGVMLTILVGIAIYLTLPVWTDILAVAWRSDEYSYIFLGLPIAAWLAWVRRERLRYCRPRRTLVGTGIVLAGWLIAALGFNAGINIAWHGGALLIVVGAVITVLGLDFVRQFLPAFGALVFLLPVPGRIRQRIAHPLQEASAYITEAGLDMFSLPVARVGNVLSINGHDVAIAEACNGMRMVVALGLITYAFVFTVPMRTSVRVALLAASPLIALAVNVIRLVPTTLLYGYSDLDAAELFHDVSGWVVLAVALGILWCIVALLRWIEVPISPYPVAEEV
jgi:exosortase